MGDDPAMPSNNLKYTDEMRERTVLHILSSGISATSVAEELWIDVNTVCRWVREHRRKINLPSYEEENGIVKNTQPKEPTETRHRIRELEAKLKAREKALADEREKVEILKRCLHIFMQARD